MNQKKQPIWLYVLPAAVACVVICVGATVWALNNYIYMDGQFYPRHAQVLDLREEEMDRDGFWLRSNRMPQTKILWSVPLHDQRVPSDAQEVTITELSDADITMFPYITELKTIHAESCTDYPRLMRLKEVMPNCDVVYTVTLDGKEYAWDASEIKVQNLTEQEVELLQYLPNLLHVDAADSTQYAVLHTLQSEHPEWNVEYTVMMGEMNVPFSTVELVAEGVTCEEVQQAIPGLPELKSLTLVNPDADREALLKLREENPEIVIHWQTEVLGRTVTDETEELDISGIRLTSVDEVERAADLCVNLKKLIMSNCGIDNATMAAFRERKRENYKVVWTIYFSPNCSARTDDLYFMPIKQGEYYFKEEYIHDLMYCEDMVTIDLGHHKIKSCEFARYMPHLKYLILAHTEIRDISPLETCKELIYLEVDWSTVRDISPLVGCTALEDLNLTHEFNEPSLEPLYQMTWLKNIWLLDWKADSRITNLVAALPDTNIVYQKPAAGKGWRNLQNYYDMRNNLGMYYMK